MRRALAAVVAAISLGVGTAAVAAMNDDHERERVKVPGSVKYDVAGDTREQIHGRSR